LSILYLIAPLHVEKNVAGGVTNARVLLAQFVTNCVGRYAVLLNDWILHR